MGLIFIQYNGKLRVTDGRSHLEYCIIKISLARCSILLFENVIFTRLFIPGHIHLSFRELGQFCLRQNNGWLSKRHRIIVSLQKNVPPWILGCFVNKSRFFLHFLDVSPSLTKVKIRTIINSSQNKDRTYLWQKVFFTANGLFILTKLFFPKKTLKDFFLQVLHVFSKKYLRIFNQKRG